MADCNNHCIRRVYYDEGLLTTPEIKGVPGLGSQKVDDLKENDELDTENTTANKSSGLQGANN